MKKVLVALDNSLAGRAVSASARALALVLDAEVEALHVRVDGRQTARRTAEAAALPLRITTGPVIDRLVEAGESADVVALALGARSSEAARRPLGSTAAAVATALAKPVLIVPPGAEPESAFRRVLVPIEGTASSPLAPRAIIELAAGAEIDAIALHVYDQSSLPSFTDQPQHEQPAWEGEFLERYCPWGIGEVRLETRVGRTGEVIPQLAEELQCDLIALGWSQELEAGRAPVVRETLERSSRPVLLVPVRLESGGEGTASLVAHEARPGSPDDADDIS
jgi:nucleotide-binding universal stress UspA family protein